MRVKAKRIGIARQGNQEVEERVSMEHKCILKPGHRGFCECPICGVLSDEEGRVKSSRRS